MLFLIPMHSTSSINSVLALTPMSSSRASWLRMSPLRESSVCLSLSWSWATEDSISPTSSMSLYWTGSLQSSTLGRFVLVSSLVWDSCIGRTLSSMAFFRRAIFSSVSLICATIWKNKFVGYDDLLILP